jgi:hypothetical protein
MDITLGGRFENALFREVTALGDRSAIETSHPYYQSLYRHSPRSYFDRCATFLAISDNVQLPMVDWTFRQQGIDRGITEEQLGIKATRIGGGEWDRDIEKFAAIALTLGAFSPSILNALSYVTAPGARLSKPNIVKVDTVGSVDGFARHHLCRLMLQVRSALELRSILVLGEEERAILTELCDFVAKTKIPAPIDLPNLLSTTTIDAENFAGGLLNFSPPDALAVAAVRADAGISKYAAKVREFISVDSSLEAQRNLVHAMREALDKHEAAARVQNIFEVVTWTAKPLNYIPGVGNLLSLGTDVVDIAKKWIERKQGDGNWFLLGAKMTDISIKDYLRRTGNL